MKPMEDNFEPKLYFYYPYPLCGLMLLLFCVSYVKDSRTNGLLLKVIIIPLLLLILFLTVQSFIIGFRPTPLYINIMNILWNIAPFLLLLIDKRVRPNRDSFIHYIIIFVCVQLLFSLFNYMGFRIYGEYSGLFDDSLICGSFVRYNHMTNYLSIFFFVLTYEFFKCDRIDVKTYYFTAFLIGLLIALSGSRMTFFLFAFTYLFFFCVSHGKKVIILTCLGIVSLFSTYVIGNDKYYGENADEGTGLERNLIGVIDLANSDDLSEGSTLALSAYLLMDMFNSPIIGNGRSFKGDSFYGNPADSWNEGVFKTDARLAYMLVDYGIVGLLLFLLLFASVFKGCFLFSEESSKSLYWGAFIYLILFSLTDNGFWDHVVFSVLLIYAFSIKGNQKNNEVLVNN